MCVRRLQKKMANKVSTQRPKRKCHCNLIVSFWHISEFISSCDMEGDMSWPTTNDVILSGTMVQSSIAVVSSSFFGGVGGLCHRQRKGGRRRRRRLGCRPKKIGSASKEGGSRYMEGCTVMEQDKRATSLDSKWRQRWPAFRFKSTVPTTSDGNSRSFRRCVTV
jgi:hypothetical protein